MAEMRAMKDIGCVSVLTNTSIFLMEDIHIWMV